jgi:3-oxoacyl-[acyl-carrier-protein] synthase II
MADTRVVITGMGAINAVASNTAAFATALQQGRCGIGPVTVFDTAAFHTHTGGEVQGFDPREAIPSSFYGKRMSRADAMAMAATLEALTDAGLFPLPDDLREDTGVVIGGGAHAGRGGRLPALSCG